VLCRLVTKCSWWGDRCLEIQVAVLIFCTACTFIRNSNPSSIFNMHIQTFVHSWWTNILSYHTVPLQNWVLKGILSVQNARKADPSGCALEGVGLYLLACWDCGFKSHQGHGCLSIVSVVCCQVEVSVTDWSLVQRSPTECGCLRQGLHKATLHATHQQVQLPDSERAEWKLALHIVCRNEKAWQWASSPLVHRSTAQRSTEEF
jgi:hypothetical protein